MKPCHNQQDPSKPQNSQRSRKHRQLEDKQSVDRNAPGSLSSSWSKNNYNINLLDAVVVTRNTPPSDRVRSLSTRPSTEAGGSSAVLTCPTSSSYSAFHIPITSSNTTGTQAASEINLQSWAYSSPNYSASVPQIRFHQPQTQTSHPQQNFSTLDQAAPPYSHLNADMSALAVQFNPGFDTGNRIAWEYSPAGFGYGNAYQAQEAHYDPFNDQIGEAIYSQPISAPPPVGSQSPEQRELKRQRDLARRATKTRTRRERSTSNPFTMSRNASPNMLPSNHPTFVESMNGLHMTNDSLLPSISSSAYLSSPSISISASASPELYETGVSSFPVVDNNFDLANNFMIPFTTSTNASTITSYAPPTSSAPLSSQSTEPYYYTTTSNNTNPQLLPQDPHDSVRIVNPRPKPQCWDHGCNGRQFSTFSNLLRHQREKSGIASKPTCHKCGAEFTRTTARNGHLQHEKCKQRRNS